VDASFLLSLLLSIQPNPSLTPGAICTANDPNFDGYVYAESIPHCRRNFSDSKKSIVAKAYGVPRSDWSQYEFDHLIPLCAGGSNDLKNVWPEPIDHAHRKDVVENEVCDGMRAGTMTQQEAIAEVFDWIRNN
jgi:hypothetical protein